MKVLCSRSVSGKCSLNRLGIPRLRGRSAVPPMPADCRPQRRGSGHGSGERGPDCSGRAERSRKPDPAGARSIWGKCAAVSNAVGWPAANADENDDGLGLDPPGDEAERFEGWCVKPLGVVDDDNLRLRRERRQRATPTPPVR